MSDKKKVYVETTVVSDATALPTHDLVQADVNLSLANGGILPRSCSTSSHPMSLQMKHGVATPMLPSGGLMRYREFPS